LRCTRLASAHCRSARRQCAASTGGAAQAAPAYLNGWRIPFGRFESNTGELLRDAACAGLGIALHSVWHICDELREGKLALVMPGYPIADTGIYAVMPQRRLVPPRVRAFVDFLAERFGPTPSWEQ
jgi:DNA-binding transcriptional LysR family regulator